MNMKDPMRLKQKNLKQAGLLNPRAELVTDPVFVKHPEFFDVYDHLQVRYEMLRSHILDGNSVVDICDRFGISRQAFYMLQEKFIEEGSAGLLPKKPGPRGPSKLTADVLAFIREEVRSEQDMTVPQLLSEIENKFAVSFHRRTIEKLVKELQSKKNS
jgi:transposase